MSGEQPRKPPALQLVRGLWKPVRELWKLRRTVHRIHEHGVQLQALKLSDIPWRYPSVNPEVWAKLAKAGDDLCTEVIPALE
jgi:hypothetical protein